MSNKIARQLELRRQFEQKQEAINNPLLGFEADRQAMRDTTTKDSEERRIYKRRLLEQYLPIADDLLADQNNSNRYNAIISYTAIWSLDIALESRKGIIEAYQRMAAVHAFGVSTDENFSTNHLKKAQYLLADDLEHNLDIESKTYNADRSYALELVDDLQVQGLWAAGLMVKLAKYIFYAAVNYEPVLEKQITIGEAMFKLGAKIKTALDALQAQAQEQSPEQEQEQEQEESPPAKLDGG